MCQFFLWVPVVNGAYTGGRDESFAVGGGLLAVARATVVVTLTIVLDFITI